MNNEFDPEYYDLNNTLVRVIQDTVHMRQHVSQLYAPLKVLQQIKADSEEYQNYRIQLARKDYYKNVVYFMDRFYSRNDMYYTYEMIGRNIDYGYAESIYENDVTYQDAFEALSFILCRKKSELNEIKKNYEDLNTNGKQNLARLAARESENEEKAREAIAACENGQPKDQLKKVKKLENLYKGYGLGHKSQLMICADKLDRYLRYVSYYNIDDDIANKFFSMKSTKNYTRSPQQIDYLTVQNLSIVDQFIEGIACGKIKIKGVNPEEPTESNMM